MAAQFRIEHTLLTFQWCMQMVRFKIVISHTFWHNVCRIPPNQ
jgi:hypothetical protein